MLSIPGMKLKTLSFLIALLAVTFDVTVAKSYASAGKCDFVHRPPSKETSPVQLTIKRLHDLHHDLFQTLRNKKGQTVLQKEIQSWISQIEQTSADYFQQAGIRVERENVSHPAVTFQGASIPLLSYTVFRIVGSDGNSFNGRLIKGILLHKKLKHLHLIYDPFLSFWNPHTEGFFQPHYQELYFGGRALYGRLSGTGDIIRHELQHAFEDLKIRSGEETLANFTFHHGHDKGSLYSSLMRADELESYLRDLRYYRFSAQRMEGSLPASSNTSGSRIVRRQNFRATLFEIKDLLKKAKSVLTELAEDPQVSGGQRENGMLQMSFHELENPYYFAARFIGKIPEGENSIDYVQARARWALSRIAEIEKEVRESEKDLQ